MFSVPSDYTLIVCEKPDAARKIAEALADSPTTTTKQYGVEALTFSRGGANYVACSALGHLYNISDAFSQRETYPVFDIEWYPGDAVSKRSRNAHKRILSIKRLASGAKAFINACDYDVEGETIGDNVLRYACGGKQEVALRAKFSTLTREDLIASFNDASVDASGRLAKAGRTRHALDFLWGINLSRALSASVNSESSGYNNITIGRVQGPTLGFVVEREIEIQTFVPDVYWTVTGHFEAEDGHFQAPSTRGRYTKKSEAESVKTTSEGQPATVSSLTKSVFRERAPPPFNTGELQKEAYKLLRYSPSKTLQIAERLYLNALISYPRTASQKLPKTLRYGDIISRLGRIEKYATIARELIGTALSPREGDMFDNAHPAIYPTGAIPRSLSSYELKLFDLIVRRFFACFGEDAVRKRISLKIDVKGNEFGLTGKQTLKRGWMKYYSRYLSNDERDVPDLVQGDVLKVTRVDCDERFESGPYRYNQASLLERMEHETIGTKATRAETIATLIARGYVTDNPIRATDLGMSLVGTMQEFCPKIVSTELTRETEIELEAIESGESNGTEVMERAMSVLLKQIENFRLNEAVVGEEIRGAVTHTKNSLSVIGVCPVCKTGNLLVIRSRKSGKRFVGCTNYSHGCRASAPLPQRGSIKPAAKPCSKCGWPVVYVRRWRYPWRLCVNQTCQGRISNSNAMQTLQKRS
jgi:DNA topoisomerase I